MTHELDIEDRTALVSWLRSLGHIGQDEEPRFCVLPGGVSNRTVLVERASGEAWVLKQALRRLRVQVEWLSSPERIEREALGIECLSRLLPPGSVPRLLFKSSAEHVLAMTAVPHPHENWKSALLAGRLDFDCVRQFGRILAAIHRESSIGARDLPPLLQDRSFFDSLRLEPYYRYTANQVAESASFYEQLVRDTLMIQVALVHGDYSPKNVLVHDGRLTLIDHEVIHVGDPGFDIGFAFTHLLSKAHHLPELRPRMHEAVLLFWDEYRSGIASLPWARDLEPRAVRHTLGCLLARVAGKSQLEYLSPEARIRQRRAVLNLVASPPAAVPELASMFLKELATCP